MTIPIIGDGDPPPVSQSRRNATVAVVGAGDCTGAAIARRFARADYTVFAGRRHGDKLASLMAEIAADGGLCVGRMLDAREVEEAILGSG